jgi:1-acyl-sn-glycerol-3-phosphate acyltransferase
MGGIKWAFDRVVRSLARLAFDVHVTGLEHVPQRGPVILATNHINSFDAFLIRATMPREIIAWAKAELWENPITRPIVRAIGTIPLRRGELDLYSVRQAVRALQAGNMLGIAPEGTRSWHGRLQRARPGLILLAQQVPQTVILPTAVYGQESFGHNARRVRRTSVQVVLGQGFRIRVQERRIPRDRRQEAIDQVMAQIALLLPRAYRGVYADPSAFGQSYLLSDWCTSAEPAMARHQGNGQEAARDEA